MKFKETSRQLVSRYAQTATFRSHALSRCKRDMVWSCESLCHVEGLFGRLKILHTSRVRTHHSFGVVSDHLKSCEIVQRDTRILAVPVGESYIDIFGAKDLCTGWYAQGERSAPGMT